MLRRGSALPLGPSLRVYWVIQKLAAAKKMRNVNAKKHKCSEAARRCVVLEVTHVDWSVLMTLLRLCKIHICGVPSCWSTLTPKITLTPKNYFKKRLFVNCRARAVTHLRKINRSCIKPEPVKSVLILCVCALFCTSVGCTVPNKRNCFFFSNKSLASQALFLPCNPYNRFVEADFTSFQCSHRTEFNSLAFAIKPVKSGNYQFKKHTLRRCAHMLEETKQCWCCIKQGSDANLNYFQSFSRLESFLNDISRSNTGTIIGNTMKSKINNLE